MMESRKLVSVPLASWRPTTLVTLMKERGRQSPLSGSRDSHGDHNRRTGLVGMPRDVVVVVVVVVVCVCVVYRGRSGRLRARARARACVCVCVVVVVVVMCV